MPLVSPTDPLKCVRLIAAAALLLLSLPIGVAAQERQTMPYVQRGWADRGGHSTTLGLARDWAWTKELERGRLAAQWQLEISRWNSDRSHSTQLGLTPAFRLSPHAWGKGWFVEGGIGLNIIAPKYAFGLRQFGSTFNFGSHIALGKTFGEASAHEISLRVQHFSNASIRKPNPGEDFLQLRYSFSPGRALGP